MAAAIFLVTRTSQGVNEDRNQVREVIVHEDDGQSDADIITALLANMNAQEPVEVGASAVYKAGYFDTVVQIGASPVADLSTDGDYLAYAPRVAFLDA